LDISSMAESNSELLAKLPVLIVGGGPVGLGLALELALRDVKSVLVEQTDGVVRLSKMGHVSVRTMEHCRRWGVAESVRTSGFPADYPLNQVFCTGLNAQHITTLEFPSHADLMFNAVSPEHKQRCPQLWFDPILARELSNRPQATIRNHTRLVGFTQDESRVSALVEDVMAGVRSTIEASYLVGCDGAGSTVRQQLGIKLLGDAVLSYSTGIYFTAPDLLKHHKMGAATRYWMVGEEGTWGNLTVVDAKHIWRLTITGSMERVEAKNFDADYWVRRCLGRDDIEYSITAVLPWRRSRLVAERYREGRVFLAGDACHVNAPNGGYGMNTGIGDSVDLGWKLAATLHDWGGAGLLDSYQKERKPIAQRNVNAAAVNFNSTRPNLSYLHVEEETEEGTAARATIARAMRESTRQEWESDGVHLGYRYENSPIVIPDGTPEPEDKLTQYVPTARPGHRAPHFYLDGHSILDSFGTGFVFLCFTDQIDDMGVIALTNAAASHAIPFVTKVITDPAAKTLYERRYVLVRPDGHVAWRSDTLDMEPAELLDIVSGRTGVKSSVPPAVRSITTHFADASGHT
jgi:2-polyprenyl-6-methoxyphenol hydroxylase-like FAD-dependent oxidoreductase